MKGRVLEPSWHYGQEIDIMKPSSALASLPDELIQAVGLILAHHVCPGGVGRNGDVVDGAFAAADDDADADDADNADDADHG